MPEDESKTKGSECKDGETDGSAYRMPPCMDSQDGSPRRVGVELEMSGIDLAVIAEELTVHCGGTVNGVSEYELKVNGTTLGDFNVDLDFEYLQKLRRENIEDAGDWVREFEEMAADVLQALLKNLIPCELISPPLPFSRIGELDVVLEGLRERGAKGSRHALLASFGLHLNFEIPDMEVSTILSYLRAFVCLESWLKEREDVDLSRKLSPFIRSYPGKYEELILGRNYSPSLDQLIGDYLEYNPTRNRVLDLLPMFAFLDEDRVMKVLPGEKIRKRPALHYRLPNSDIDNPGWGIWQSWNDWQQVEFLASSPRRLGEVCAACRESRASGYLLMEPPSWKEEVKKWLNVPS